MLVGCESDEEPKSNNTLFTLMPASYTGVDFVNQLEYDEDFNIYTYRNFYNGGGVGLGDINNDSLIDVFFISNLKSNKLYLNKGDFKFEDITDQAGVGGKRGWSTGVSVADVNGDGWLDIYVCNSGLVKGDDRQNELFINNGDLTFTEQAQAYGLADRGYSTHAAFFDYDRDGDLDMYLLNNSFKAIGSFDLKKNERNKRDSIGGDKLFRNDGNKFVDVSEEAGIFGSIIGFGLGVTVGDINKDGWMDLYISNDFFERDYIYMNNGDGTFSEQLENQMRSISAASMGAAMADVNNDGYSDIFVTEMLPDKDERLKSITTFESWDRYQLSLKNGYYYQFTRNMLHLNNGNSTFSEIGRLAGVEASDWSWAALIFDFDNDGNKDIFVANGIFRDLTNQDYIQHISNKETMRSIITRDKVDYKKLIETIPSNKISNYAYVNGASLGYKYNRYKFENKADSLGLAEPSHSNGSAYGDLDNDGDLDLVINNVNMPSFIYRNETNELLPNNHYLKFNLIGEKANPFAVGTKITIKHKGKTFYQEYVPVRGFQSTMGQRPTIGLGNIAKVDTVLIEWPDQTSSLLTDVKSDQMLTLKQKEGKPSRIDELPEREQREPKIFTEVDNDRIPYTHKENEFVDFNRERLLFHMRSTEGPGLDCGDINNDGLTDVYIGGAKDSPGALLVQLPSGAFKPSNQSLFLADKISEDTDALFFDADNDGDLDLYVTSGGNEFPSSSSALKDRLYINDGRGNFSKSPQLLPVNKYVNTSCVKAADFDGDGDQDLFVGARLKPFLYGVPVSGYLLENDGQGQFKDVSEQMAPGLNEIGMIRDAIWSDIDNDDDSDLIVVGEWMPIKIFINNGKGFDEVSIDKSNGWWNVIEGADLDNDGDMDFVVGNHGLNSRFHASVDKPTTLYVNDFDHNGTVEQIICVYNGEQSYPMVLRHDIVSQIPSLEKKYEQYEEYKGQQINDIFTDAQLNDAIKHEVFDMETSVLWNNGSKGFSLERLPIEAQFSPVYGILIEDFDGDGNKDILMGGNLHSVKPEVGKYDASYGTYLKGDRHGAFKSVKPQASGIMLMGEVRGIELLPIKNRSYILVARNNDKPQLFEWNSDQSIREHDSPAEGLTQK